MVADRRWLQALAGYVATETASSPPDELLPMAADLAPTQTAANEVVAARPENGVVAVTATVVLMTALAMSVHVITNDPAVAAVPQVPGADTPFTDETMPFTWTGVGGFGILTCTELARTVPPTVSPSALA